MSFDAKSQLRKFLAEDIGDGDITSSLLAKKNVQANIISRDDTIIAGTEFVKMIFELNGCQANILQNDGEWAIPNKPIVNIYGDVKLLLTCERTALNLFARMSGIATQTRRLVDKIPKDTKLYATRKTAPGLRYFDKIAVEIGGGYRHRMKLDEMVMIKDNHIAAESLDVLIKKASEKHDKFEVEVENIQDAMLAARGGATIIMLDNFSPAQIKKTIEMLEKQKLRDKVTLEASGGINFNNISKFSETGVDIISVGSITNAVNGADMSLEVISES